jgi:hypothetical protein
MLWRKVLVAVLPFAWTFGTLFAIEQAANFYFLIDNPAVFFAISGWRLPLFVAISVMGSVAAGVLTKELWVGILSESAGVLVAFLTFYWFCDPRVCFSAGLDGLEPLRMGFFLLSIVVAGTALGTSIRGRRVARRAGLLVGFCAFAAVAYLPVIFTFAGTRVLWDLHPWAVLATLAIVGFSTSASLALQVGRRAGFAVPLASFSVLVIVSSGIAAAYLASLATDVALMLCATSAASACGVLATTWKNPTPLLRRSISGVYALGLLLVLVIMLASVPDAVNGVVPGVTGPTSVFTMGTPVYAGAYMDAPAGHANGAGVTVDFASTNATSIQVDNFLSAGIGIHAAGCCVDGIDYSYRFDVYLFHGGNESIAASAWEVCDDNAACGGHSWKSLIFLQTEPLGSSAEGKNITLRVAWTQFQSGTGVAWSFSAGGMGRTEFAVFIPPEAENHDFNTGVLEGGTLGPQQTGSYFLQFGIMSRYAIGHGGWKAELGCPSILTNSWECVSHARTLAGDQSYWKVFWRWGEDYQDVSVTPAGSQGLVFQFAQKATPSFGILW